MHKARLLSVQALPSDTGRYKLSRRLTVFSVDDFAGFERVHGFRPPAGAVQEDLTISGISVETLLMGTVMDIQAVEGIVRLEVLDVPPPPGRTRLSPGSELLNSYLAERHLPPFYCRVAIPGQVWPNADITVYPSEQRGVMKRRIETVQEYYKKRCQGRV